MKVILLERIGRLGTIGDEVSVRNGFARNHLLPRGKALRADAANRARFESEREQIVQRNAERRDNAMLVATAVNGKKVKIIRQAGETGVLYGSVSSRDIADALGAENIEVSKSQIDLSNPIKNIGVHTVALSLHPEVDSSVIVIVARSDDEAERQTAGEDPVDTSDETETGLEPAAAHEDSSEEDAGVNDSE